MPPTINGPLRAHTNVPSAVDDSAVFLHDNYPWVSLQNPQVIDVGGGNGHVSIDLARVRLPSLIFPHPY
jgi:16S rRNA G1207 methylase RsmC